MSALDNPFPHDPAGSQPGQTSCRCDQPTSELPKWIEITVRRSGRTAQTIISESTIKNLDNRRDTMASILEELIARVL